jgi:hypothetical protein
MRIRKRRASLRLPELLRLWGGLGLLLFIVGFAVERMNDCVAGDVRAHPFYAIAPGLDSADLPAPAREKLIAELNHRYCTCGCLMTLASCRNNHMSCRTSKRLGQEMLESAHGKF